MAKTTIKSNRFSEYFQKKLDRSRRSQKEIAEIVGYKNQNMITMLKLGDVKLALDKVPAMAKALEVDPVDLFKITLTQTYDDKSIRLLNEIIEAGISPVERRILEIVRNACDSNGIELTAEREEQLARIFN